ncbi:cytochrome c family protein [Parasphingorhabdus sp.]|uniref:c-type cytochrome n=1 Tax=Parasphingorhabdus sp. TaxID=2709688 RepID=UPI003593C3E8
MVRMKTMAAVVAMSVLAAACSGGGSESSEPATTEAEAPEPAVEVVAAPAAPADAGPPAADDFTTVDGVEYSSLTSDAAAGKLVFAQCRTCHVTDPGVNRTGPSLAGIVGRESGSVAGYNYSAANADSDVVWTEEKLFQYLENPQRVIPKTKMIFAGLPDAQKRADVIAYLKNPS